ncbi:MAG: type II toxin-antitoxin system RelE/ParE family toxin [Methanosarcinales archaeon]|nr:type II toxin-antitoxin system RelE/ParE family toxin [Methanosarcinales archaeon]
MSKPIFLSKIAKKQLDSLPDDTKNRIKNALYTLIDAQKSRKIDTKKLKGIKGREDLFRLRIGNYRIVYFEDVKSIKIIQIFHRGKEYKWL